jgi:GDP-mannose 6-dehydrogenase
MKVSVLGLGYVGTVSAACLARSGHQVIGVDANTLKVDCINRGMSPIVEPGVGDLLSEAKAQGNLSATSDPTSAVRQTDLSLICVGTPSKKNGGLDLDQVLRVAEQIGHALADATTYHAVVIRSTVLPGTVEKVERIVATASGRISGKGFGVAANPEFLREGTSLHDFAHPPFTIVGATDAKVVEMLRELYRNVDAPFHSMRVREAEVLKYACNAFHAVKVAFANEIGQICKSLGIDSHAVMKVFVEDTKLNISPYYLKPGFAFGGSCLPKDVRAITHEARQLDVDAPLLGSLIASNELQVQRAVDWVVARRKKRVGILGLSFKPDTDDVRESPIVRVVETLIGKGFQVSIFDANVNLARLVGANRAYIEAEIPHIASLMKDSIQNVLDDAEVVVIANDSKEFRDLRTRLRPCQSLLDLVRVDSAALSQGNYEGFAW